MKVLVLGGGPAGMTAAIAAAGKGAEVLLLEQNDRVGKKLLLTGNGKCNYTNLELDAARYDTDLPSRPVRLPPESRLSSRNGWQA